MMRIADGGQNASRSEFFQLRECAPVCLDKPGKRRARSYSFH